MSMHVHDIQWWISPSNRILQSIISDTSAFKKKNEIPGPGWISSISNRITSHQENVWKKYPCAMLTKQKACSEIARCTASNTSARWDNRTQRYKRLRKVLSYYHQPKYKFITQVGPTTFILKCGAHIINSSHTHSTGSCSSHSEEKK